jgi:hypothetical protein
MIAGQERRIRSGQSLALVDLVQAVFAAELLAPSQPLWIASPWITNLELLDNTGRQYAGIMPSWPPRQVRLIEVLEALIHRGGRLVVVTRDVDINRPLLDEVRRRGWPSRSYVEILTDTIHEKGITGEGFTLDGSMNLTNTGLRIKEEYVIYSTKSEVVGKRRLEFRDRWQAHLDRV